MLQKAPFRLPHRFLTKFGYPGRRRFVALYWEPGGDEACYDDGDSFACGLCDNGLFLGFVYQLPVAQWLSENGIHLGDSEREARHWLVADALTGDLYAAPRGEASSATEKSVVHFDEAHELDKEFQVALYLAIDKRKVLLNTRSNQGPQAIPLADFTLILSTTDEYALLQPLRDRMKLILRFTYYSATELIEVLRQRSWALRWAVEDKVFPEIARRSRGTPRLALRLLQACRRVCRAEGQTGITLDHLVRACLLEEIDHLGLGPVDQQYLVVLADGTSRLHVVASRLGLHARTVAEVIEPYLLRVGLICKDDQGRRQLTAEGREHLSQSRPGSG